MENQDHVKEIGLKWAMKQAEDLVNGGAPCVHFYIMNDTERVLEVVKNFR